MREWNSSKVFTGNFWSWLLGMEGERSTETPELSGCLSLSCSNLPMTDVRRHHGTLGEARSVQMVSLVKIWTLMEKQLVLAERVEFDRSPILFSVLLLEHLSLDTAQALDLYGPWTSTLWPFLYPHTSEK